jgi:hypothetical protein
VPSSLPPIMASSEESTREAKKRPASCFVNSVFSRKGTAFSSVSLDATSDWAGSFGLFSLFTRSALILKASSEDERGQFET